MAHAANDPPASKSRLHSGSMPRCTQVDTGDGRGRAPYPGTWLLSSCDSMSYPVGILILRTTSYDPRRGTEAFHVWGGAAPCRTLPGPPSRRLPAVR
jgi:hypothetical protein